MNKIKFLTNYIEKEGFYVTLIHIINFLILLIFKKNSFIKTPFHKTKIYITKKICILSNYKILYGPYKNVRFNKNV